MNATRAYVLLIVLTGFAAAGCDNKPAVPPVSETASPETAPKTQPVDLSKRHPLELLYLPVSVRVPDGWEVKPEGHTVFLEGPVPAPSTLPNVSIQLSRQATMSDADYASFLRGTQARMARGPLQIDGPRRAGQLTILEERSVPPARQTRPAALPGVVSPLFHWTVWVFVESKGHTHERYVLNFLDLDAETYQANKDFLRSIVDSIAYDPAADVAPSVDTHP